MRVEFWALNYHDEMDNLRVKVFDSEDAAVDWYKHPPLGCAPTGKIWLL